LRLCVKIHFQLYRFSQTVKTQSQTAHNKWQRDTNYAAAARP
jgi:hypothetical protein